MADVNDRRSDCQQQFEQILRELDTYKKDHDIVVQLREKIESLTRSVNALVRSIWGMMTSLILILAGFIIWYIQSDLH